MFTKKNLVDFFSSQEYKWIKLPEPESEPLEKKTRSRSQSRLKIYRLPSPTNKIVCTSFFPNGFMCYFAFLGNAK